MPSRHNTIASRRLGLGLSLGFSLGLSLTLACGRADQGVGQAQVPTSRPAAAAPVKPVEAPVPEPVVLPEPDLEKSLGNFNMTYYWVAAQKKSGGEPIFDKKCKTIARVSKSFKRRLSLEGTGILKDGRTVSRAGACKCGAPCYWVPEASHKWGAGVGQRPLSPFRSIAVDPKEIKIGTSLYVAELDGLTMPGSGSEGGFVHDGCVIADDRGGGVRGKQIDFFAGRKQHYKNFFSRHKLTKVSVYPGGQRCKARSADDSPRLANAGSS